MAPKMENKGAVDLANNWGIGGCTRHVDVRQCFLRELNSFTALDGCDCSLFNELCGRIVSLPIYVHC
jgi:hypothetical protein